MKSLFAIAMGLAALGAAPAMAQNAVITTTGTTVTSGTGVVVTPSGAPAIINSTRMLPGGVTVATGPASVAAAGNTLTTTQTYWVNVPAGAVHDDEFKRWQALK